MNSLRGTKFLILILLAVLLITACGLSDEESIAVSVALTQTAGDRGRCCSSAGGYRSAARDLYGRSSAIGSRRVRPIGGVYGQ